MTSRRAGPVHYRDFGGEGPPVLLTHGMAAHTHWWDPVVPHWEGRLRAAALDFRGHGDSDWLEDGLYTSERWVEDIETARAALGLERFLLVGHSMGARIALDYAERHGARLLGVVAIDFLPEFYSSRERSYEKTRARPQPMYSGPEPMIEKFRLQPPGTLLDAEGLRALGAKGVARRGEGWTWKFDWRAFAFPYGPVWPQLPRVGPPALIVRGEHSTVMPREALERVVAGLPRGSGAEIAGAHHHATLDKPAEVARLVADFAATLEAA